MCLHEKFVTGSIYNFSISKEMIYVEMYFI